MMQHNFYTGFGDLGQTHLADGRVVSKTNPIIAAKGDVEELCSFLALIQYHVRRYPRKTELIEELISDLYVVQADISTSYYIGRALGITPDHVRKLENWCDLIEKKLDLSEPVEEREEGEDIALMAIAFSVCRRAERSVVAASLENPVNPELLKYMNRLSSCLFLFIKGMILL